MLKYIICIILILICPSSTHLLSSNSPNPYSNETLNILPTLQESYCTPNWTSSSAFPSFENTTGSAQFSFAKDIFGFLWTPDFIVSDGFGPNQSTIKFKLYLKYYYDNEFSSRATLEVVNGSGKFDLPANISMASTHLYPLNISVISDDLQYNFTMLAGPTSCTTDDNVYISWGIIILIQILKVSYLFTIVKNMEYLYKRIDLIGLLMLLCFDSYVYGASFSFYKYPMPIMLFSILIFPLIPFLMMTLNYIWIKKMRLRIVWKLLNFGLPLYFFISPFFPALTTMQLLPMIMQTVFPIIHIFRNFTKSLKNQWSMVWWIIYGPLNFTFFYFAPPNVGQLYHDFGYSVMFILMIVEGIFLFIQKRRPKIFIVDWNDTCKICNREFDTEQRGLLDEELIIKKLYETSCGHRFHDDCLKTYFLEKSECPVCKSYIIGVPSANL